MSAIAQRVAANTLPHLPGHGVVAKRRAANNYGHFLLEMIPMAVAGATACEGDPPVFLLHRVDPPMLDVALRAFRLLGEQPRRLILADFLEPLHVERLVIVRGLIDHGKYMSPLCVSSVNQLSATIPPGERKRLFVRRRPGWQRGRRMVNETELASRLEALGFVSIEPGELTLEEQIAAFSGADEVVGVIGAAMTNIVFCGPGTRVVMLASAHFPDTFFWFIAMHKGLRYSEIRGDPLTGAEVDTRSDFRIRDADIAWLESLYQPAQPGPAGEVRAHVRGIGDMQGNIGAWIGVRGSGRWIEGFGIVAAFDDIQYRAVLGRNWLSPWVTNGSFCGTSGVDLPVHGLSVRLAGDMERQFDCLVNATFVDGSYRTGVSAGQPCTADSMAPLEAFQLVLTPKG